MTSLTNERQLAKAQERAKQDKITEELVIKTLMSQPNGRRWLWLLVSKCGVFRSSFDPSAGGHSRMCFTEGQRTLGLELFGLITALCPADYIRMTNENSPQKIKELDDERSDDDAN
jgi:hypothetical protein